jgi:serine/threonine protein kinase/Tfp pilus assembly protein PilF
MKCPRCQADNPDTSRFCGNCAAALIPEKPGFSTKTIPSPFPIPKEGDLFANKYRIIGEIGRGGMGVVLKSEDIKLKRYVALKFLPPEFMFSPEARNRFIREAQAAASLDHPNICTVYEAEEQEGQVYIAMAYIDGRTLKERIAQKAISFDEAKNIAAQVAEGLEEAHRKGIIHRDIKPANIMLTDKGQIKIMDFGLAKLESAGDITKTSAVIGTVAYMSPEQALGKKIDARTDIWSFGCLLYEMLAGQGPFQAGHEQAVFHAIVNSDPQSISTLRDGVPNQLEKILEKCLQKDPRNRYSNTSSLIEDLKTVNVQNIAIAPSFPTQKPIPSIAVLPFADMSPEKDQDYFAEGIAEELIHALSRIQGLHVVSRTSAFTFKGKNQDIRDIGRTLNVKTILEGSVRKAGSRLRITAQLINIEDGYHLWSERFDRDAADVFAIQDEISLAIVENLKVTLRVGEKTALKKRSTDDPEAYNLYLKGLYFAARPDTESLKKALNFFRAAIERDPNFALAHAGIAQIYGSLGVMYLAPLSEVLPQARESLRKAFDLDENLAEAHAQAAALAFWFDWDWESAEKSLNQVLELNPGDAFSHGILSWYLLSRRRFDEAIRIVKKTISLDPLMPLYYAWSVGIHASSGRYDDAIREFAKAKELDPQLGLAYFHAGYAYILKGDLDTAIETLEFSKKFGVYPGWAEGFLTLAYLKKGEKDKATHNFKKQLEEMEKTMPSFTSLAWQAAALGDFDLAFEFFDRAYKARDLLVIFILIYTDFFAPELQRDPRFYDLLIKMKLVD